MSTTSPAATVLLIGAAATASIDAWNLLLRTVGMPSLDYCLLGRWIRYMPRAFVHGNIVKAPARRFECTTGWIAHYGIGIGLAMVFARLFPGWMARPTLVPALAFGIATVVFPFFVLQPALGLGIASSSTRHPARARLKSLMTHAVYGIGLFAWARIAPYLLSR